MSPDRTDTEKRAAPRQRTLKGAKITFKDDAFSYRCVVRNISLTGANLSVDATDGIPNRFQLVFDDNSRRRTCTVVWRSPTRLGVAFE